MKVFKVLCVDTATHCQILAEDCSYNSACFWLESEGLINPNNVKIKWDFKTNRYLILDGSTCFIYDENRGLLLSD